MAPAYRTARAVSSWRCWPWTHCIRPVSYTHLLPAIYAGGRAYVSSFAYAVFEACVQGDPQAKAIFQEGVDYFADALKHACAYLDKPCVVALGGGIFLHYPSYVNALRCQAPAGCEFRLLDAPAVYGLSLIHIYNTPRALTATSSSAPLVLLYSTEARLTGTAAISISP